MYNTNITVVYRNSLLVNNCHHSSLTMCRLRTIQPHWRHARNLDGIGRFVYIACCDKVEAGEDACYVGSDVADGLAGLGEGGLRDGVVGWVELELHHVAYGCYDVVWREFFGAIAATDGYDVDGLRCEFERWLVLV